MTDPGVAVDLEVAEHGLVASGVEGCSSSPARPMAWVMSVLQLGQSMCDLQALTGVLAGYS